MITAGQRRELEHARPGNPPDGPVTLQIMVFATDGAFMGSAPVTRQPSWLWRDGKLSLSYSPVRVIVQHRGAYSTALICAVSADGRVYRPLWPLSLGKPQELKAGDDINITDGIIALTPDLPGPHG